MFRMLPAFFLLIFAASAAPIDGKWNGQITGRDGSPRPISFTFKAEGGTLTGNAQSPMGDVPIQGGRITGDEISFHVSMQFGDRSVKITYSGKLAGDELKMKSQREGAPRSMEFTLKRSSPGALLILRKPPSPGVV